MKYLLVTISFLLSISGICQPIFEGIVHYELTIKTDSMARLDVTAYFKKNKIKIETAVKKTSGGMDLKNETILLNFKEATIDRFKDNKTIERQRLRSNGGKRDIPDLSPHLQKTLVILNHSCTEFTTGPFSKEEIKDSVTVTSKGEIRIFYANDLLFPVPDSLQMIEMIPLFTNGRIALRTEIKIEQGPVVILLTCEAKKIAPAQNGLPDSLFSYPEGYSLKFNE